MTRRTKGRIVVVTPTEPYAFAQANGRYCHALLKGLDQAGWRVRCLAVANNPVWETGAREAFAGSGVNLSFYPLETANGFSLRKKWRTFRQPYSYTLSDQLRRDVDSERRQGWDVLHLEQLWSAYLAEAEDRALTSVHHLVTLDLRGEWHASFRYLRSKRLMIQTERRLLTRLRQIRATTPRLADAVHRVNARVATHVVPIALDPGLFRFESDDTADAPTIGFLASMAWNPGYVAAVRLLTRIFPRVRARRPDARVLIGGWGASRLSKLAGPGIEIVDNVPEVEPYLRRLQVLAYPLPKGSGMMTKVLEAMAYGVPVITTTEGSEGFAIEDGVHGHIEDDDDAFADKVVQLLGDRDCRRAIRRHARELVERVYSPAPVVAQLEQAYATL